MQSSHDQLFINLDNINVEEISVISEEATRGVPEFAASSCYNCECLPGGCSCATDLDAL